MRHRQAELLLKVFKRQVVQKDVARLEAGLLRDDDEIAFYAVARLRTSPPAMSPATVTSSPKNWFLSAITLSLVPHLSFNSLTKPESVG